MDLDAAQLSSISSALDDLSARVTALADSLGATPRGDVAASLYEVERQLAAAAGRMRKLIREV